MNALQIVNSDQKQCSRCALVQPIDSFPWKNRARGLRRSWCRSCARAYSHQHYLDNIDRYKAKARRNSGSDRKRIRALVDEYLRAHPCVDCGASDIAILEFDHRDPAEKRMEIASLASNAGWATVLREIEKCDVRCANCHRRRTARQFGWTKTRALPDPEPLQLVASAARVESSDAQFLRECCWCFWVKPLSEFAFKSATRQTLSSHCRKCHAAYRRKHYLRNRSDYISRATRQMRHRKARNRYLAREYLLSHHCIDCGESEIAALDFDHVDPKTKAFAIGTLLRVRSWTSIEREIAKCVVRCANCHRRRTIAQQAAARDADLLVELASTRE